jgi:hypothetical protein
MTAQLDIFDAIAQADAHHEGARDLAGNDPRHYEDYQRFLDAVIAVGRLVDGRMLVSQNDLRLQLVEQTQQGPRCSIEQHRYSAYFSRACKDNVIRVVVDADGQKLRDTCVTSFTGNNGKPQLMYELLTRT